MTQHKHAEMIKAKADNMELVVFMKSNISEGWHELPDDKKFPIFFSHHEYFLCHPRNTKECLHWLNGGDVEYDNATSWVLYDLSVDNPKYPLQDFTGLEFNFSIKPRKEKRWVGVDKNGFPTGNTYQTKEQAMSDVLNPSEFQLIEIEREV